MNVWRWIGFSIFMLGTVCLIGTTKFAATAQGKDKTTTPVDKTKTDKTDKTDKTKTDKTDKTEKTKDEKTKDEKTKAEPKVEAKGDAWTFSAFKAKGKSFYQEQTTKTSQDMKVMGQTVKQVQDQTFLIKWTPLEEKGGDYVVKQEIVGVKMDINIGGNKISYDSTSASKAKNPMTDFFEQLTKQELTFTISSDLQKVKSIEGRDKFIKGLSDINPQMQSLLKAILSDEALTKMAEPTWLAFPKEGKVGADKKWNRKSELNLGPIGKYDTNFDFTYKGTGQDADEHKIDIATKLTYTQPDAASKAGLPFIIHSATLTADGGTGNAIFDAKKGRFKSTDMKMTLTGTLEIEVGSMKTKVELTQTQDAKTTTMDDMPANWQAKKSN